MTRVQRTFWFVSVATSLVACRIDERPPPAPAPSMPSSPATPTSPTSPTAPDAAPDLDAKDAKGLLKLVDTMKAELKDKPRDFGIDMALANLFYDNGRFIEALGYYRDAGKIADEAEKLALAAKGKPAAHAVPASCRAEDAEAKDGKRTFESTLAAVKRLAPNSPEAVACLRELVPTLATLRTRRGNAWYLAGNGDKAREEHEAALALDPDQPEALFFRGAQILERAKGDPAQLARGRAEWEHLLRVAPDHPRSAVVRETMPRIDELFGARAGEAPLAPMLGRQAPSPLPQGPAPLPPGMAEAAQNAKLTPEQGAELDERLTKGEGLLAQGKWQEALDTFKTVMPVRADGRVALGMGIALRELGKPTAERVLIQAARMPGADAARARFELAVLYEKTNPAAAKEMFEALRADPMWGAKASERLGKLR